MIFSAFNKTRLKYYLLILLLCVLLILTTACNDDPGTFKEVKTDAYKAGDILEVILKVNTYFQQNLSANHDSWDDAVYHTGNIRAYMAAGEEYNYPNYAKTHNFLVNDGKDTIHGDDYCISQLYIDLYKLRSQEYKLEDVLRNAYSWVDLLYMGSPVFCRIN